MEQPQAENEDADGQSRLTARLGAWMRCELCLPDDETPVLICFADGDIRIGELRWEKPGYEDTFHAFRYWDNPHDDGQQWEHKDIVYWAPLPDAPNV